MLASLRSLALSTKAESIPTPAGKLSIMVPMIVPICHYCMSPSSGHFAESCSSEGFFLPFKVDQPDVHHEVILLDPNEHIYILYYIDATRSCNLASTFLDSVACGGYATRRTVFDVPF